MKNIPATTDSTKELPIEVSEAPNEEVHLPEISEIGLADQSVTPENMKPSKDQSCGVFSSSNSNWFADDAIISWESFSEVESFCREPFVLDTSDNHNDHLSPTFEDGGIFTSYSTYLDDKIYVLYQWMEEFP
ncbi:hypothetical protein ACH5RR_028955 [Cinchona calisaya]|uniref:Uncharacterized protein n=1 Tax=Cinchona calisaya TaxID=153742 RepID=A0ABD2YS08_9GENT